MAAGVEQVFEYTMHWGDEPAGLPDLPRVINTRVGKGFDQVKIVFTVDFADHPAFGDGPEALTPHVSGNTASLSAGVLQRNPGTGGLRLAFSLEPGDAQGVELRAQLLKSGTPVSEVWLYRWTA